LTWSALQNPDSYSAPGPGGQRGTHTKFRTIGTDPKTRREVSVLSLGAMRFGTTTDEAVPFAILD
jgi:hypothetical protein